MGFVGGERGREKAAVPFGGFCFHPGTLGPAGLSGRPPPPLWGHQWHPRGVWCQGLVSPQILLGDRAPATLFQGQ